MWIDLLFGASLFLGFYYGYKLRFFYPLLAVVLFFIAIVSIFFFKSYLLNYYSDIESILADERRRKLLIGAGLLVAILVLYLFFSKKNLPHNRRTSTSNIDANALGSGLLAAFLATLLYGVMLTFVQQAGLISAAQTELSHCYAYVVMIPEFILEIISSNRIR